MNEIILQDIEWLIKNVDGKRFDNSRILITGASGAIARYLVHFFMELYKNHGVKCEVHALVRDSKKAEKIFEDWLQEKNFHLHIGNVEDNGSLARNMTYIFHAAGISATKMFDSCPVDVLSANVIGTYQLLEQAKENSLLKKFVFFSSGAVYGNPLDPYMPSNEEVYYSFNPFQTGGCYTEGKRLGELWCRAYWKQYGVSTSIVRIGHCYGPGIDLNSGHVYADIVNAILKGKDIRIRNPHVVRPFTYIRDTIYGILIVALSADSGQAYNLWNSRERISIGYLADRLIKNVFTSSKLKVYCNDQEYFYNGQDEKKIGTMKTDTEKIEKLGWKACVGVEEGFQRTVNSFMNLA